jgi:hypothetical protein
MMKLILMDRLFNQLSPVEKHFRRAWKGSTCAPSIPTIKRVFKIIEDEDFQRPYDLYRFVFWTTYLIPLAHGRKQKTHWAGRALSVPWDKTTMSTWNINEETVHIVFLFCLQYCQVFIPSGLC